jgi:ABC-type lipoprotein release transport system permease subunit
VTFLGVTLAVAAVAALASVVPAWRAVRVDPIAALRAE